jgi:flagellar P-ring protein precursor FlgI
MKAADGQVYASAQGAVVIAGYSAAGSGSRQVMNHPTAGRIPSGAIVERGIPLTEVKNEVRLQLRTPDFSTAARITDVINRKFHTDGRPIAYAQNSALISILIPQTYAGRAVEFISAVETLNVESDRVSRIVISERTGTIALGREIRIAPVSILHGPLTVQIETEFHVSQPEPLSQGKTTVVPQAAVAIREETAKNIALKQGSTVDDLVRALQTIGSTPRDIIAILQSLKAAGALDAEVEII